ncbi:MAG: 16S rRNA (cytidine(1402)-2'-O)-methyltransferase [Oscillospiraceae bacterium]|nr:16S rRNA (cytidine(1402)-2'-O)-methyltransferase [Oscillospiraceae bacterium]
MTGDKAMGTLYVVATPIGNLGDMSPRAKETLSSCGLVLAEDTRGFGKLLASYGIKAKVASCHKFNEAERGREVMGALLAGGMDVALVTDAGTPCISDPGHAVVKAARMAGIPVVPLPGPSAVAAALSVCGFEASSFSFHGFFPRTEKRRRGLMERVVRGWEDEGVPVTVIYEAPGRVAATLRYMRPFAPDAYVCLCNDISKYYERTYWGPIGKVLDELTANVDGGKGEYTLVMSVGGDGLGDRVGTAVGGTAIGGTSVGGTAISGTAIGGGVGGADAPSEGADAPGEGPGARKAQPIATEALLLDWLIKNRGVPANGEGGAASAAAGPEGPAASGRGRAQGKPAMKDAVRAVSSTCRIPKNEAYQASLNLIRIMSEWGLGG